MKRTIQGVLDFLQRVTPVRLVAMGYLFYAFLGWILLCLPLAQKQDHISWLDNLFTSVSALSTTGLVTTSTGNGYTLLGQIVILLLLQIGGIGYMTFGSFVILSHSGSLSDRRREIAKTVFSIPASLHIDNLLRSVIVFTLFIEMAGAVALYMAFCSAGMPNSLWSAVFHSVSAFCTAGFGLYDNSFEGYRNAFWINIILSVLSYLGAIGFIVFLDVWRRVTSRSSCITLTSKVILVSTFWITLIGIFLFYVGEPSIQALDPAERLTASLFQVMTALTTVGFNSIPIGELSQASLFLLIMLMIVGASPSGTGGGLKTTTFSAVIGVMRSALHGLDRVYYWGKEVPPQRVWLALASLGFYFVFLVLGCYLLALVEPFRFEALLFECASALSTVGLSTGITSQLSHLGKLIIIFLMFVGRVGPLAFGVALFLERSPLVGKDSEDLAI